MVKCKGYMKKIQDGRYISMDSYGNCEYVDTSVLENGMPWAQPVAEEDYDGTKHFLKTYYKHAEKKFTGIVVGIKDVIVTAYLVCETQYHYNGGEYTCIRKEVEDVRTCALVFFANNRSRLVLIDDLDIMRQNELVSGCDSKCPSAGV